MNECAPHLHHLPSHLLIQSVIAAPDVNTKRMLMLKDTEKPCITLSDEISPVATDSIDTRVKKKKGNV